MRQVPIFMSNVAESSIRFTVETFSSLIIIDQFTEFTEFTAISVNFTVAITNLKFLIEVICLSHTTKHE